MKAFHALSGLPRSGSTLLAALLSQNPAISASMSSPVLPILSGMLRGMASDNEGALFISRSQKEDMLREVVLSYYASASDETVVIDTNRGWTASLSLLLSLFPAARAICCVRDIPWVLDSLERLIQRNPLEPSGIYGFSPDGNAYTRASKVMKDTGLIGFPYNSLKQALHGEHRSRILVVQYDSLAARPQECIDLIYSFLGLRPFQHRFDHVEFTAGDEFDRRLGTPGLHSVRPTVALIPRSPCIPPDLFSQWRGGDFWTRSEVSSPGVDMI